MPTTDEVRAMFPAYDADTDEERDLHEVVRSKVTELAVFLNDALGDAAPGLLVALQRDTADAHTGIAHRFEEPFPDVG